jgi:acyl-CoA reductase-like NAD-dependent aldehyde dehydrogenase
MALRRPLGVVVGISPWNGVHVLAWRTVVNPLAFGNTVVRRRRPCRSPTSSSIATRSGASTSPAPPRPAASSPNGRAAPGLSAGLIIGDNQRGFAVARRIDSGVVQVNDQTVADEPQLPLGGMKDSGWGRSGPASMRNFTEIQWITTREAPVTSPSKGLRDPPGVSGDRIPLSHGRGG